MSSTPMPPFCEDAEPSPADTRALSTEEVVALKGRLEPPHKLSGPDPHYTEDAIEHGVQGTMLVACRVMTNGCVVACRVVQSLPRLDGPVINALRRRHYKPALLDGNPVNVEWTFKITMKLPGVFRR